MDRQKNILIVDDEYVSLTKLNLLLSAYAECESATSGEQALELFKLAHEEERPYDLITLDISMGGQTGIQTLCDIRKLELEYQKKNKANNCHVDIVMITAMTDEESICFSYESGCTELITKPLTKKELQDSMKKLGWKEL